MSTANLMTANAGNGQRWVVMDIEGTEGTTANPAASDWQDVTTFEVKPTGTYLEFRPVTGYRPGQTGTFTAQHASVNVSRPVRLRAVSLADGTDEPNIARQLRHSGATEVRDATNDAYTYCFGVSQGETATYIEHHNNAAVDDSVRTTVLAVRTGFSYRIAAGELVMFSGEGFGVIPAVNTPRAPQSAAFDGSSVSDPWGAPLAGDGWTMRIYDIDNTQVITGGSLASPGTTPTILSVDYTDENTVDPRESVQASSGVQGFTSNKAEGRVTIRMERDVYDNFNPFAALADGRPLEIWLQKDQGSNHVGILHYGHLDSPVEDYEIAGGRYITTLVLRLNTPAPANDATAPGQVPGQVATAGTNRGIAIASSGLVAANTYVQIWTA